MSIKTQYSNMLSAGNIFDKSVIGKLFYVFEYTNHLEFMNEGSQLAFEMKKLQIQGWTEFNQCIDALEFSANEFFKQVIYLSFF